MARNFKVIFSIAFDVVADDSDEGLDKAREEFKELLSKLNEYDFDFQLKNEAP